MPQSMKMLYRLRRQARVTIIEKGVCSRSSLGDLFEFLSPDRQFATLLCAETSAAWSFTFISIADEASIKEIG